MQHQRVVLFREVGAPEVLEVSASPIFPSIADAMTRARDTFPPYRPEDLVLELLQWCPDHTLSAQILTRAGLSRAVTAVLNLEDRA